MLYLKKSEQNDELLTDTLVLMDLRDEECTF